MKDSYVLLSFMELLMSNQQTFEDWLIDPSNQYSILFKEIVASTEAIDESVNQLQETINSIGELV